MAAARNSVKVPTYVLIVSVLAVLIALAALTFALQKPASEPVTKTQETELAPHQETVTEQVPLKYVITEATNITRYYNYTTYVSANIWIRNVDSETGEFSVTAEAKISGKTNSQKQSYVLSPNTVKRFNFEFQIGEGKFQDYSYTVLPANKTVTQTITKYVQVVKTTENSS